MLAGGYSDARASMYTYEALLLGSYEGSTSLPATCEFEQTSREIQSEIWINVNFGNVDLASDR